MFIILATAFLDILGIWILIPVLPDIITYFGVDESWNPYSQWIYSIGMFIGGLIFWRLSDIYGRKRLLLATTSFNLLGYIILWISLSQWIIHESIWFMFILFLVGRFISGLGWAWIWVAQAYISDISTPATKTKNMGMIGAAFWFAFLVWPAIGWLLSKWWIDNVILWCIIAICINWIVIVAILKEPIKHIQEMNTPHTAFHFSKTIIVLLILSFGGTLAFSSIQSGSSQFYKDVFDFNADHIWYTLSLIWFIAIVYQWWLIKYVRRYLSEIKMIQWALLLMAISIFFFAINRDIYLLYIIVCLFPISMGTFQPAINTLIAWKAQKEVGKVMWYNTSIVSIAGIIWPFIVGSLYNISYSLPFIFSALIAFILYVIAIFWLKN